LNLLSEWDFRIPLGSVQFLGLNLFLVNEPALVRRLMVDEVEAFPKHPYTLWMLEPLIGRGVFSVNGQEWAQQRALVDQALQVAQLRRVFPQMQAACGASMARLGQAIGAVGSMGREVAVEMGEEMTLYTADVIVRTILSKALEPGEAVQLFAAFGRYQKRAGRALILRFLRLPQGGLQRYLAAHAAPIRAWIAAAVDERLRQPFRGQHNDLLAALIAARDPQTGARFDRDALVDQVCVLFLAGHETSASALAMATYLLSRYPLAQQRLHLEVEAILQVRSVDGEDPAAPLAIDDLRQLPYGSALFSETLRLYPPLSFFIREAQGTTALAESRCPMRSLVTISPWVIQRHEHHWSDPDGFRPERFLAHTACPQEKQWAKDAFLPFGLGPRKCPGSAFAFQEALLVLAELVRRYELLPDPGHQPDLVARLTLRSRNGVRLRLRERS
jgi:cytochrome P450